MSQVILGFRITFLLKGEFKLENYKLIFALRAFGQMKFLDERFQNLSFGTLADLTTARFNKLHERLDAFDNDQLQKFYSKREQTRTENNDTASAQALYRLEAAQRLLDQVYSNEILVTIFVVREYKN